MHMVFPKLFYMDIHSRDKIRLQHNFMFKLTLTLSVIGVLD